ncbi:hypothetical protein QCA50_016487 [Cerrena zonata]|uniref:Uncharacterized protein n=1 Tax=Cerrena zonata TaxID=2478898 RepID=A0AAW0FHD2_9APHY
MEDATDISFYLGKQAVESIGNLDIPLSNGQIVSINLVNELPDDPNELISFLETENCPKKYWIAVGQAYAQSNKLDDAVKLITKALTLKQFNEKDKVSLNSFLSWVYLKYASKGINKQENLTNASDLINKINSMDNANVSNILAREMRLTMLCKPLIDY